MALFCFRNHWSPGILLYRLCLIFPKSSTIVCQSVMFKFTDPGQSFGDRLSLEGPRVAGFRKALFVTDGFCTTEERLQSICTCVVI